MGERERKKRQTRQRLSDAALELFAVHGYDATTVEMIAGEVGVSARTFFRYFDTKDQILAAPGSRLMEAVAERLGTMPPERRGIPTVLETMADLLADDGILSPIEIQAWSSRTSPQLRDAVADLRHRWAGQLAELLADEDGREQPTFDERVVCSASVAVMGTVFDEWFRLERETDVFSLVRQAATAVCDPSPGSGNAGSSS